MASVQENRQTTGVISNRPKKEVRTWKRIANAEKTPNCGMGSPAVGVTMQRKRKKKKKKKRRSDGEEEPELDSKPGLRSKNDLSTKKSMLKH